MGCFKSFLRTPCAVFGPSAHASLNARGIQSTADDMVTNPWQILYAASADQDHRVLLEAMALTRDICCHLDTIG